MEEIEDNEVRYLEDYLSEQMIDDLTEEIAKIHNDEMYILSILSAFDDDDQARELLDFLRKNSNLNRSNIIYATVDIYNKYRDIH